MKVVAYNADDVVKVVGHFGYSTDLVFAGYEDVGAGAIAVGDSDAWEVAPAGNHLFVKPKAKGAVTNMTVVTSRRTYQFSPDAREVAGVTRGDNANMFFQVRFTYPDDEQAAAKALADQRRRESEERRMQSLLNSPVVPKNYNYYGCGTRELWPTEVFDDGRFTYLRFPNAQEIPAIFIVNSDRTESLVNGGMHEDQYVVQATARKLVLRKGKSVACLENRSFNPGHRHAARHDESELDPKDEGERTAHSVVPGAGGSQRTRCERMGHAAREAAAAAAGDHAAGAGAGRGARATAT